MCDDRREVEEQVEETPALAPEPRGGRPQEPVERAVKSPPESR